MCDLMTQLRLELSNRRIHWWDNSNDIFDRTRCLINDNEWSIIAGEYINELEIWNLTTADNEDDEGPTAGLNVEEALAIMFGEEYV